MYDSSLHHGVLLQMVQRPLNETAHVSPMSLNGGTRPLPRHRSMDGLLINSSSLLRGIRLRNMLSNGNR